MNGPSTARPAARPAADLSPTPDGSSANGSGSRSPAATTRGQTGVPTPTIAASPDATPADPLAADEREAWHQAQLLVAAHRICPGCGTAMVDRSCKLRCLHCGFFLDCSDG